MSSESERECGTLDRLIYFGRLPTEVPGDDKAMKSWLVVGVCIPDCCISSYQGADSTSFTVCTF